MSERLLPRRTLISYGLGSAAPTAAYEFCGAFLLIFYTELVHLDPIWVGYAFSFRMVLDALVDPSIGYLSDHTRFKSGRRRPYFLIGSIPGILLLWLAFTPPTGSSLWQFSYLTVVTSLMVCCLSLTAIPHMAMSFEITADYDERVRVVGYRSFVESVSSLIALFSVPIALGLDGASLGGHPLSRADCYLLAAVVLGILGLIAALVSYFGTTEQTQDLRHCGYGFREGIIAILQNREFRILLIVYTLIVIANRVALAQLFIVLEHFYGKREEETIPLLLAFYLGSLLTIPLWVFLGTKLGKNRALCAAMFVWPLTYLALVAIRWPDPLLCAVAFCMGMSFCGILTMLGAIVPEVLDVDRSKSGQRREGIYASVANLVWQAGLGIGFLITGFTLHAIGYRGSELPTREVVNGLRFSIASFPMVLGFGAFVAFCFFPITKARHNEILRDQLMDEEQP